ncbi:hypothetical protein GUI34_17115 [Escherichia coli]|nr:hypothetical protein [Escherichia coli]
MECDLLMIKIEKVINKNDLKAFIAFPSSLYPDDPNWIPPLFIERSGNDSNLLIVFYVQIMPDDFVMQLHRF